MQSAHFYASKLEGCQVLVQRNEEQRVLPRELQKAIVSGAVLVTANLSRVAVAGFSAEEAPRSPQSDETLVCVIPTVADPPSVTFTDEFLPQFKTALQDTAGSYLATLPKTATAQHFDSMDEDAIAKCNAALSTQIWLHNESESKSARTMPRLGAQIYKIMLKAKQTAKVIESAGEHWFLKAIYQNQLCPVILPHKEEPMTPAQAQYYCRDDQKLKSHVSAGAPQVIKGLYDIQGTTGKYWQEKVPRDHRCILYKYMMYKYKLLAFRKTHRELARTFDALAIRGNKCRAALEEFSRVFLPDLMEDEEKYTDVLTSGGRLCSDLATKHVQKMAGSLSTADQIEKEALKALANCAKQLDADSNGLDPSNYKTYCEKWLPGIDPAVAVPYLEFNHKQAVKDIQATSGTSALQQGAASSQQQQQLPPMYDGPSVGRAKHQLMNSTRGRGRGRGTRMKPTSRRRNKPATTVQEYLKLK